MKNFFKGDDLMFGLPVNLKKAGFYKINPETLGKGWFEIGPIRPPSEGKDCSLLIRVIRTAPGIAVNFAVLIKVNVFPTVALKK